MSFTTLLRECEDAAAVLAAFLSHADAGSASSLSRNVCESSLRSTFLRASRVTLPPSAEFVASFLSALSPPASNAIGFVDVADAASGVHVLRALPLVTRLRIRGDADGHRCPFALDASLFGSVVTKSASSPLLGNLTALDLSNSSVQDISALSCGSGISQLTSLNLGRNLGIRDFSPLATLTKLESLNLQGTLLSSIEFVRNMPELRELNLNATIHLADLQPVSSLTKLRAVHLGRKINSSFAPLLSSAATLVRLEAAWSKFETDDGEWSAVLSALSNLEHLDLLGVKALTSLAPVAQLTKLTHLNVQACPVDELAPLCGLGNLETLILGWSNVHNFSALKVLTKLKRLDVQGKQLKSVESLANLEYFKGFGTLPRLPKRGRLQEVSFCFSDDNFTFRLAGIRSLRSLSLSGKFDLEQVVPSVPSLRQLELFVSDPVDLAPVGALVELRRLTIRLPAKVSEAADAQQDYSFLSRLVNLRQLWLFKCDITDLSPLSSLSLLKILHIGSPALQDISLLQSLANLEQVHIAETSVSNVECLQQLGSLQRVTIPPSADRSCLVMQYGQQRLPRLKDVVCSGRNWIYLPCEAL